jgi:transcriptional regulator with PAS, ATPase and Fis domain
MSTGVSLIGRSSALRLVQQEVEYAARSDAKVLITGASGVGKEIVAHLIHARSKRRHASLFTINCAALPDTLLESELFGHARGSFTDAYRDKRGLLESAHAGTLFMDEVGEMSLRMQALLLRFLETGEIQRLGTDDRRKLSADVRVIAATNRTILEDIKAGTFREDLYYRLNVIHITIPPLKERRDDVAPLLDHFFRLFSEQHRLEVPVLSPDATTLLEAYDWPGNVRELRNIAERLICRGLGRPIERDDLPREILSYALIASQSATTRTALPIAGQALLQRILNGESFWDCAYEPFMSRDLTRDDLRFLVRAGLEETRGNYKALVQLFNMPQQDYKRFLSFLRKYGCHMPFQRFRTAGPRPGVQSAPEAPDARSRAMNS